MAAEISASSQIRSPRARWLDLGAAAASGLLMALGQALALPGSGAELGRGGWLDPLALVGLVPLLVRLAGQAPRRWLWLGWLGGVVYFSFSLWWVTRPMVTFTPIPLVGAVPIAGLLVCFLALFWAGAFWLARRIERELGLPWAWGLPLVWVAGLFLRNCLLTGFPWAAVGYSQVRSLWLAQLASLGGIYLLTFAVVGANALLADLVIRLRSRERPAWGRVGFWLGFFALAGLWAALRLTGPAAPPGARTITAAAVQGNLDERYPLRGPLAEAWALERLLLASRAAERQGAGLVVWPEGSLPEPVPAGARSLDSGFSRAVRGRPFSAELVLGGIGWGRRDGALYKTNSAFVTDGAGTVLGRYDKGHLVPFGEYVPLAGILPWQWFVPARTVFFSPGADQAPIATPRGRLGFLICYEAIFPQIAREAVASGAELLVNITNDAWFGPTAAPYQHLVMSRLRSIETGRYQIRAANTGVSALVDSRGRELARLPVGLSSSPARRLTRAQLTPARTLVGRLALLDDTTPYVLLGDWFAWACLLAALALWGATLAARRLPPYQKRPDPAPKVS